MSRLTKIEPLYRGWTGASLPRSFFEPDALGLCGGVEYGFSSTTTAREQAVHYAQGSASTVLELEMGMIDRGAEIAWLSQCVRQTWRGAPMPAPDAYALLTPCRAPRRSARERDPPPAAYGAGRQRHERRRRHAGR